MTIEFTTGIAQNNTLYVEAAEGAFQIGDTVVTEGRFAAVTRKRRGAPAPHPAGTLVRTLKITGKGEAFHPDFMSDETKQRFYGEVIEEQRIYDAE
ncbi:hypothetical protein [Vreelandella populi]|uniref:hypothetical protein n=1 Tax=Vreelandella populi TaxID=2498858 RepID=UPI000F8D0BA1|nr:hypothetical protein [Halomonas populi]RUR52715.1 hypothetical protein ELY40_11740 [Halomonas populi]